MDLLPWWQRVSSAASNCAENINFLESLVFSRICFECSFPHSIFLKFFSKSKWLQGFQSCCFLIRSTFFTCSKPYVMSAAMVLYDMISLSSGVWITLNSNFFFGFLSYWNTMCEHLVHVSIFVGIKWSPEMGENKLNLQIPKPGVTGRILSNNESFWSDLINMRCCNLAKM